MLNTDLYPAPNSIPVRNGDGNMYTATALGFKGEDFEIPIIMNKSGHINSGNLTVWDSGNLPSEYGTFTARVNGFGTERDGLNIIVNGCSYRRIGNLVHVMIRIQFSFNAKSGAPSSEQVRIVGLPFQFPAYTCVSIGFATGVNLNNEHKQLFGYVHPDGGIAFLSENLSSNSETFRILTSANFIKNGNTSPVIDIGLSFTSMI